LQKILFDQLLLSFSVLNNEFFEGLKANIDEGNGVDFCVLVNWNNSVEASSSYKIQATRRGLQIIFKNCITGYRIQL